MVVFHSTVKTSCLSFRTLHRGNNSFGVLKHFSITQETSTQFLENACEVSSILKPCLRTPLLSFLRFVLYYLFDIQFARSSSSPRFPCELNEGCVCTYSTLHDNRVTRALPMLCTKSAYNGDGFLGGITWGSQKRCLIHRACSICRAATNLGSRVSCQCRTSLLVTRTTHAHYTHTSRQRRMFESIYLRKPFSNLILLCDLNVFFFRVMGHWGLSVIAQTILILIVNQKKQSLFLFLI